MREQVFYVYRYSLTALAALVFLFASALVFQGWMAHSAEIFLSYAEAGLSYCL